MKLDDDVKDEEISEADCERAEPSAKHQVHRGIIDNRLIVLTDRATFIEQVKRMEAKRSRSARISCETCFQEEGLVSPKANIPAKSNFYMSMGLAL